MSMLDKMRGSAGKPSSDTLTQQELSFLLKVLHDCKFDGKDVLLLAEVVGKLKNQFEAK